MNAITPTTHLHALTVVGQSMYSPTGSQLFNNGQRYLKALNPSWPEPIIPMSTSASIKGVVVYKVTEVA